MQNLNAQNKPNLELAFQTLLNDSDKKSKDDAINGLTNIGNIRTLYEDRLESEKGTILKRIHTFNAFWFGWKAAYPNTKLVK